MDDTVLGLLIYFIPIVIAMLRRHPHFIAIAVVNLFYGWTIIGWFGALAWAISSKEE